MSWRCILQTLFNWLVLAIIIFFMWPAAHALTLGSPIILSKPKEPLRAEIPVRIGVEDQADSESLQINPIERTDYERLGISPRILEYKPTITLKRVNPKQFVLVVTTTNPIEAEKDPFIDVILGLRWTNGSMAKTYSLMVGDVNRVIVLSGQSLSEIASQISPQLGNIDIDQAMLALYKANPDAFIGGSIHRLKVGVELNKPSVNVLGSITPAEAKEFVADANQQWLEQKSQIASDNSKSASNSSSAPLSQSSDTEGGDRLRIGAGTGSEDETKRSVEEIVAQEKALAQTNARIVELEKNIADLQKLLEIQKQEKQAIISSNPKTPIDQWGPALAGVALVASTGLLLWYLARYTRRAETQNHTPVKNEEQTTNVTEIDQPSLIPSRASEILSNLDLNLTPSTESGAQAADTLRVKINLARAYITIEDYVAARKALEEILLVSNQVDPQITISARGLMAEINQRSDS